MCSRFSCVAAAIDRFTLDIMQAVENAAECRSVRNS